MQSNCIYDPLFQGPCQDDCFIFKSKKLHITYITQIYISFGKALEKYLNFYSQILYYLFVYHWLWHWWQWGCLRFLSHKLFYQILWFNDLTPFCSFTDSICHLLNPLDKDINWMYNRRSEDFLYVLSRFDVCSVSSRKVTEVTKNLQEFFYVYSSSKFMGVTVLSCFSE